MCNNIDRFKRMVPRRKKSDMKGYLLHESFTPYSTKGKREGEKLISSCQGLEVRGSTDPKGA